MKERPILFSAKMVRALLDGTKTQTRRIVKPQPYPDSKFAGGFAIPQLKRLLKFPQIAADISVEAPYVHDCCPYGRPGDRLWVRESFWGCDLPGYGDQPCVVYDDEWVGKEYRPSEARPWGRKFGRIPSIHMPRDSSRILLEIVSVRVERLQDISEADAKAEGASPLRKYANEGQEAYQSSFCNLWKAINGADSWDANPFVWAIKFKPAVISTLKEK